MEFPKISARDFQRYRREFWEHKSRESYRAKIIEKALDAKVTCP